MRVRFAGYPESYVFAEPREKSKKLNHLLWGDYVRLLGEEHDGWAKVRTRGVTGWMRQTDLQEGRLLEINFVDVGQGDGCFIVTPEDEFILIDAGQKENMHRFLRWRFNLRNHPEQQITIKAVILSHPDSDHYGGLAPILKDGQFAIDTIFHNGIIDHGGSGMDSLGARHKHARRSYLIDLPTDREALRLLTRNAGQRTYAGLLSTALQSSSSDIRMLSAEDEQVPGFGDGRAWSVSVLAPVLEEVNGYKALRVLGDKGKTKNGHSIVLKFTYGKATVLLGGDLNTESENYLLEHYTNMDPRDLDGSSGEEELLAAARDVLESDIAKACHHGSRDFSELFLQAINATATVISSGDDEPHCHPRPDTIGALGKFGRGRRPLIFSTELSRSTKERQRRPGVLSSEIERLIARRDRAASDDERSKIQAKIEAKWADLERSVAVYGLINVRTDGEKVLIAQKLERPRGSQKWDMHFLEPNSHGELVYTRHSG